MHFSVVGETEKPNGKPIGFRFGFGCQNGFGLVLVDIDMFAMQTVYEVYPHWWYTKIVMKKTKKVLFSTFG